MKRIFLTAASAVLASVVMVGAASASITFTPVQGDRIDGSDVLAARSVTANMVDDDVDTFYSLGIGGTLIASIAPDFIASASVIEVTFSNNINYPESAKLYLGTDTGGTLLGELFNDASGSFATSAAGTITTTANDPTPG